MKRSTNNDETILSLKKWQSREQAKKWGYKNIYGLSIAMLTTNTAYIGLVSIQSSINPTIGLISLSLMFASAFVAAFLTPSILKLLGTKYTTLVGILCVLLYVLANIYPSWYILIPSSAIAGFTSRPMWAAVYSHLAEIAVEIAPVLNKNKNYLIGKFSGLLFAIFQTSYITGNLASSLILYPYTQTEDHELKGANKTENNDSITEDFEMCTLSRTDVEQKFIYILAAVSAAIAVAGVVVLLVFVDRLPTDNQFFSTKKKFQVYLKRPLTDILSVLRSVKLMLLAPMMALWGLETSFSLGTFTEVSNSYYSIIL